jgi:hypothetical protein
MIVEVLGARAHSHFGGPEISLDTFEFSGDAAGAVRQLDRV